ncbi:rab-GTPase-TBC domain-containing protein [Lineolata rhizophorae]|uniref:GTPase-activating protein GYP5 n=1 Tax=Lineolata rhizophorae TaxID=578093 RepID=A0A6A6P887_9PEZI|nr:rab-GTPase-TBC domain-containing protein [Lineolata rhizophorae]
MNGERHDGSVPAQNHPEHSSDAESRKPRKPSYSAERISTVGMDDVNLEEYKEATSNGASSRPSPPVLPPRVPPRDSSASSSTRQGFFATSAPPVEKQITAPPPPSRKLTSPFSWLSRNKTDNDKKPSISPPVAPTERRDTVSSMATLNSNPELMLSRMEDAESADSGTHGRATRNSLRDRFKFLRMREEAGIVSLDDDGGGGQPAPAGNASGVGSPAAAAAAAATTDDKKEAPDGSLPAPAMSRGPSSPGPAPTSPVPSMARPTVNPHLPPGTASGVAAGPGGDSAAPVDWDLWQSVVYEGPAAVARTSAEELGQAIAAGIPQAIRGVVWQVLAQSKNEELEGVYRELVARGSEHKEKGGGIGFFGAGKESGGHVNGTAAGKEKESIASSASSVHSDYSTPATINTNAPGTPPSKDGANGSSNGADIAKAQTALLAAKKQKAKEEAAALAKLEKQIKRDLGARTSYSKFVMASGLQDALFGVCKAYALFDESVGYAQGMNFIAMPLLFNMPEEEAFCLMVRLMNKYGLRELFVQDMPGLHLHLYQFERLLEDFEPALYCHLHRRGVAPQLYATQWFLTLFAYRFPLQLVLRVYDLILSEGLEGAILKFGLALMRKNAAALLAMRDMAQLTTFLKERLFDAYIDRAPSASSILDSGFFGAATSAADKEVYRADVLVQDACAARITPDMLRGYAAEWAELRRERREREQEAETLRAANAGLAAKVRGLEERAEKGDAEHVQVASELVRTKVENERLADANESLRGRVEELGRIVEAQTEEVERRMRGEMDQVMARNMQVHNENRALEEQLAEMEKVLVETKVQYAQINSEYETLKQKWNNITTMLNNP